MPMRNSTLCLVAIIIFTCGCISQAQLTIVKNGEPAATIVVAASVRAELDPLTVITGVDPAPPAADLSNPAVAAREFRHYVQKITGAHLPIVSESTPPDGPRILIGRSTLTDKIRGLDIPAGLTGSLREEGFVIHCDNQTLVLAGNDQIPYYGTRYAVCEMLERFGVRWIIPGEFGEVIPKTSTLTVPKMSITERPDFAIRRVTDDDQWAIHNKLNQRIHYWAGIVGDNTLGGSGSRGYIGDPEVFDAHPEWFALNEDGETRNPRMVCMTHPGAVQLVADKCKAEAAAGISDVFKHAYS
ncbi:MAG: hypothetical protein CMJ49_08530, partial [Planctomycetaceae bacterium]|nr:hypothetical protein [Planctomycetaceae bacterium]